MIANLTIDFEATSVVLTRITIDSCTSYSVGQIFFERGIFSVEINESLFQNNNGMMGEADLRVEAAGYVKLQSTEFHNFLSNSEASGMSTTISQALPLNFGVEMINVTYS